MGIDYHVYLGPYACVKAPPRTVRVPHRGCFRAGCSRAVRQDFIVGGRFCPDCGGPLEERQVEREGARLELDELFPGEPLSNQGLRTDDGLEIVIPNLNRDPPREFLFYPREMGQLELEVCPGTAVAECGWFLLAFDAELRALREKFGDVVVRWGLLMWQY